MSHHDSNHDADDLTQIGTSEDPNVLDPARGLFGYIPANKAIHIGTTAQEVVEHFMENGRRILAQHGEVPGLVMFFSGRWTPFGVTGTDFDKWRENAELLIQSMPAVTGYAIVSEVWTRDPVTMERNGECLSVLVVERGAPPVSLMERIVRDAEGKATGTEPHVVDGGPVTSVGGRLAEMFGPVPPVH